MQNTIFHYNKKRKHWHKTSWDRFYYELQYYPFHLDDARKILVTSFFSQKTISYLDLQMSQAATSFRQMEDCLLLRSETRYLLKKGFFCTEESFRNSFLPNRRLLYTLNLDFPDGREYSHLRNGIAPINVNLHPESIFLIVGSSDRFYEEALHRLIEQAFRKTDCKLKFLKWMADFRPLESILMLIRTSSYIQNTCLKTLYRECENSEFVMKCFEKLIVIRGMYDDIRKVKAVEYFLYHARLCDFDVRNKEFTCCSSLTDYCITHTSLLGLVPSFLKYEDTVYYSKESHSLYHWFVISFSRPELWEEEMSRPKSQMDNLKRYRVLQILRIFQCHRRKEINYGASETLRLVWSSIPDPFVSLQEMSDTYGQNISSEYINRAHSFYEEAIGQIVSCPEPRRLSQYCRTVIRRSLYNAKQWLPDGIQQLNLPPLVKSFLNLQTDNLKPENFHAPQEIDVAFK